MNSYSEQCAGDMASREGLPHLRYSTTRREDAFEDAIKHAIVQLKRGDTISAEATLKDVLKFQYGKDE